MILYLIGLLWITFYLPNINQLTYIAFSVYTGWISIALIANITILILKYQIKLFVDHSILWYVIVMITGVTIGLSVLVTTGNLFYILVFMWAYAWIFIKHLRKTDHFLPTNLNNFNALFTYDFIYWHTCSFFIIKALFIALNIESSFKIRQFGVFFSFLRV